MNYTTLTYNGTVSRRGAEGAERSGFRQKAGSRKECGGLPTRRYGPRLGAILLL